MTTPPEPTTPTPLITEDAIAARVAEMAAQIDEDYADVDELVLLGVLKGSFIFLADLARRLSVPRRIEFIAVTSYGTSESTDPGAVRLLMDVRHPIERVHVLIIEDIVDTGQTLAYLQRILRARGPASLKTCALVRKQERAEVDVAVDYVGFDIPDVWVVGYGLDWAEQYRALPAICTIEP